jgi:hypothetical protein
MAWLLNLLSDSPALALLAMVSAVCLLGLINGLISHSPPYEARISEKARREGQVSHPSVLEAHYREGHAHQVREGHRTIKASINCNGMM